ncbi:MAG: asparagine synthase (glutamine-hydrolyzing) [Candidatus Acidiferrum sp.]
MCGIAGIVNISSDQSVGAADIRRMCNQIIHRGPDDEGIHVAGPVGLGMRRLSIIDLSTGQQPIYNEDRSVWVVFNGEIYNFPELRPELESRGHHFYTNSDTEVIAHLYEEYGSDCTKKLRGMFAFALWDDKRRSLLLARDRFGKKPLHYALTQGRLVFGSEIRALLAVAPELSEADPKGLIDYFCYGYVPDPHTAFKGIQKLAPGHTLEFSGGQIRIQQYWNLSNFGTAPAGSEEECLEELERRLSEAVRIRLISDVPLGALLSGGVDSSTVVALMSRHSTRPVKTFTIGFKKEDFNEANYARIVAERFGTEHHEFIVEPDFLEILDKLTHHLEEPFADSSIVPTFCVSRLAREHVTVALAGDGGDELFAGYDRYGINLRRRRLGMIPPSVGRLYRNVVFPLLPASTYGRRFLYTLSLPVEDRYLDEISFLSTDGRERSMFSPDFLSIADKNPSPFELFREHLRHVQSEDAVTQLQYLDTKTYLVGDVLTKVDRMSMATSLEVRAPILDHDFAEFVAMLPSEYKLRGNQHKYILKRLAERVGVPRSVIYRPKKGFAVPLVHWFRNELKQDLLGILLEPQTLQRGYFRPESVRQLIEEHTRGRRDRSGDLWILLIFELWQRNFLGTLPLSNA